jgi:hypothetical protein
VAVFIHGPCGVLTMSGSARARRNPHAAALTEEAFGSGLVGSHGDGHKFFLIAQEPTFKMRVGFAQAQAPAHHLVSVVLTEEALKAPTL